MGYLYTDTTLSIYVRGISACFFPDGTAQLKQPGTKSFEVVYARTKAFPSSVIRPGNGTDPLDLPKSKLETLVKGTIWRDAHFAGKSFIQIAREHQCSRSYVMQLIDKSLDIR